MTAKTVKLHLLDVEGTVAPISLVYERLFPYARAHFEPFLWRTLADPEQDLSEGGVFWDLMMLGLESRAEEVPVVMESETGASSSGTSERVSLWPDPPRAT